MHKRLIYVNSEIFAQRMVMEHERKPLTQLFAFFFHEKLKKYSGDHRSPLFRIQRTTISTATGTCFLRLPFWAHLVFQSKYTDLDHGYLTSVFERELTKPKN